MTPDVNTGGPWEVLIPRLATTDLKDCSSYFFMSTNSALHSLNNVCVRSLISKNFLHFFVTYVSKGKVFGFWTAGQTKEAISRRHFWAS